MPKVSVIIPSHNLGNYLPETLLSVQNQTFTDWECLIVEDGSRDGSLAIVNQWCNLDSRFIPIVFKEPQGVAAARNKGLKLAHGEYILLLDADDLITSGYMAAAVQALDADPSLTLVYGQAERFGAQTSWDLPAFDMGTMLASNCLYISCFFRRAALGSEVAPQESAITGTAARPGHLAVAFDPDFKAGYEDWDFWLSLLEREKHPRVLCLPELCFRYRTRRGSRNDGVTDEDLRQIRYLLWEKHKALYAQYFCNPCQTVEYRRLERSFTKASRWSLAWKLRLLYRRLFR